MQVVSQMKCSMCLYGSSMCPIYNDEACRKGSKFTPSAYWKEPLIGACISKCDDPEFLMVVHYGDHEVTNVTLKPAANIGEVNNLISRVYGPRRIEVLDRSGSFVMEQLKGSTILCNVSNRKRSYSAWRSTDSQGKL